MRPPRPQPVAGAELIARLDAEVGPNLRATTAFSERNG
jgi:hypothetical protein